MGSIAEDGTMWFKIWSLIEAGGWTIFNHMASVCDWTSNLTC